MGSLLDEYLAHEAWSRTPEAQRILAMASSSSTAGIASSTAGVAPGIFRRGLAVFGNTYQSKSTVFRECLADFQVSSSAQAYVVINDKQGFRD